MIYGIYGKRLSLRTALLFSGCGAAVCYIISGFSSIPVLSLMACSFTGFFVGLMCPGAFALASRLFPGGGTKISGKLSLLENIGCAVGPWTVGAISSSFRVRTQDLCLHHCIQCFLLLRYGSTLIFTAEKANKTNNILTLFHYSVKEKENTG